MRRFTLNATALIVLGGLASGAALLAQAMKPGHERVPPYREPSPYMSQADIQAGLNKLDPKLVASRTGRRSRLRERQSAGSSPSPDARPAVRHHAYPDRRVHHRDEGHGHAGHRRHPDSADDR